MDSNVKIVELDDTNTCEFCNNALARYCCPKCNLKYCTLTCYQSEKHLQCSEEFYKNCIAEELSLQDGAESKKKMFEILQRGQLQDENSDSSSEELDSDDNACCPGLCERLANVDLNKADVVWDKLTEDEKQGFLAFISEHDNRQCIQLWQPWWLHTTKVEEVANADKYKSECPEIIQIKNFCEISKKQPADCVRFNLINIIAAYVFTVRYYDGDHCNIPKEVTSCMVSISLTLKDNQNFQDFETAVKSVEFECVNSDWIRGAESNFKLMREDIEKVLHGPHVSDSKFYILCALSDLYKLFNLSLNKEDVRAKFSKFLPNEHFPKSKLLSKNKIKSCSKKIEYLLSYAKDCFFL